MGMKNFLVGLIIFLTNTLEGITGFGSTVLSLPFLNILIGLRPAVQLFGVLGWVMAFYIVLRSWRSIIWKEIFFIALWVGLGLPFGMWMFDAVNPEKLCVLLGAYMIIMGFRGWKQTLRNRSGSANVQNGSPRSIWIRIFLFCGGIIQGAFGSGGPFVIIYAAKAIQDKRSFRVTLSLIWVIMNTVRLTNWLMHGELLNREMGALLLLCLPVTITGLLLGDYLHRKVSEYHFRLGVYILLAVSGLFMLVSNILKLIA